ncbi:hypothetical protein ACGF13_26855 [Kitasatospora sp. NPDC048286]|uniref:hypothetical protein n=1 Tax=Kitasatospora sp. NPDC048286 TaxID=3364047 RepID=UPI003713E024
MSTTCPTCAAADETVAVREALLDTDRPLDPPTRELLSMPSEPGGASVAAITLFVLAGLFGLLGLRALLSGDGDGNGDSSDTAYQAGYHYGALLVAAILLGIGLAVHARYRKRRSGAAEQWPRTYDQWQRLHRVWRATWLCRRCRAVFLPAASLRPDSAASPSAASPAVPVAQFRQWAATVARQDDHSGAPTTSA